MDYHIWESLAKRTEIEEREGEQRTGIGILYWLGEDSTSQSHTCGKVNSIFYKCLKVHKGPFSYV